MNKTPGSSEKDELAGSFFIAITISELEEY